MGLAGRGANGKTGNVGKAGQAGGAGGDAGNGGKGGAGGNANGGAFFVASGALNAGNVMYGGTISNVLLRAGSGSRAPRTARRATAARAARAANRRVLPPPCSSTSIRTSVAVAAFLVPPDLDLDQDLDLDPGLDLDPAGAPSRLPAGSGGAGGAGGDYEGGKPGTAGGGGGGGGGGGSSSSGSSFSSFVRIAAVPPGGGGGGGRAAAGGDGGAGGGAAGGGVYVLSGWLSLDAVTFYGNTVQGGKGGTGATGVVGGKGGTGGGGGTSIQGAVTGKGGVGGHGGDGGYGGYGGTGGAGQGGGCAVLDGSLTLITPTFGANLAHGGIGGMGGAAAQGSAARPGGPGGTGRTGGAGGTGGHATDGSSNASGAGGGTGGNGYGGGICQLGGTVNLYGGDFTTPNVAWGGSGGPGGNGPAGGVGGNGGDEAVNIGKAPSGPGGKGGNGGDGGDAGDAGDGGNGQGASAYIVMGSTMTVTGATPPGGTDTPGHVGKPGTTPGAAGMYGNGGTSQDGAADHGNLGNAGGPGGAGKVGMDTDPGVSGSTSANGPATDITRFVFSPLLGAASSGVNFKYPVYVVAEDDAGNVFPGYDGTVSLLANTVASAKIPGTINQTLGTVDSAGAKFGLAIFNNVNIKYGGPSMDFEASSAGISSVTGTFSVSYSPAQIKAAYGINQLTETGAGQTIAIVDAYNDPNIEADLTAFDAAYGLPAPPSFKVFDQTGQAINPANTAVAMDPLGGWEGEEALDVEWAHAMAPGASIDFVVSNSNLTTDLIAAVNAAAKLPGVSVVSMSFSGGDNVDNSVLYQTEFSTELSDDSALSESGVTFVASSGDYGAPSGYPSYSPNVVSVGGTALYINPNNSYAREIGWSVGNDAGNLRAGAGGGVSSFETEPSYQAGVQTTGERTAPDLAMVADSNTGVAVLDTFNNKGGIAPWSGVGGTSVSAPCFAGLIALVNQGRRGIRQKRPQHQHHPRPAQPRRDAASHLQHARRRFSQRHHGHQRRSQRQAHQCIQLQRDCRARHSRGQSAHSWPDRLHSGHSEPSAPPRGQGRPGLHPAHHRHRRQQQHQSHVYHHFRRRAQRGDDHERHERAGFQRPAAGFGHRHHQRHSHRHSRLDEYEELHAQHRAG